METPAHAPEHRPLDYAIQPHDTLADIARRHGVTLQMLDRANPEQQLSVRRLVAGDTLSVPPPPMSATHRLTEGGFDPTFAGADTTVGLSSKIGGASRSWEWNPATGSVKGAVEAGGALPRLRDPQLAVAAGASAEQAVTRDEDGRYSVKLTRQVDASATLEQRTSAASASATAREGHRVSYVVALPQGIADERAAVAAAARIDPLDPSTLPVGATVRLNRQAFSETSMEASFQRAAARFGPATRSSLLEAEGLGYSITRTGENAVQVLIGPNRALEAYHAAGLRSDVATAMLGRQDRLGASELHAARFDLSSPDGQAAFAHLLANGEIAHRTPGVSDVARIERLDYGSAARMDLGLGPEQLRLQAQLSGPENTGALVRTTFPDGSYGQLTDLRYGQGVPLRVEQRFDAEGNELDHLRSYRFTVDTDRPGYGLFQRFLGRDEAAEERDMAYFVNSAVRGEFDPADAPVTPGARVELVFDERQMTALMAQMRAADAAVPVGPRDWDWIAAREADGRPVESAEFAVALARRLQNDPYAFAQALHSAARGADGDHADDRIARIDATVLDAQGRVLHGQLPVAAPAREPAAPADAGPARAGGGAHEVVARLTEAAQDGPQAFRQALDDIRDTAYGRAFEQRMAQALEAQTQERQAQHREAPARSGPDAPAMGAP
ncbi:MULTISPECIES: LysM peptidoglycan-binding domain-containing protein [Luteimonas]|uniref:LysM peptidoglycan-binding domain-containing protein n=1 Tax=Luteimonas TaxID=83614 RepID=UPI0012683301|nr:MULTISPECIES: LysM domain-containing protein [Luteimonas]